jgi:methionyl-tRNA formyltransferase
MEVPILFAGTPANAADTLRHLVTSGFNVVGVLTRPDAEVGRRRELTPSAVAIAAGELGLPLIKANRVDQAVIQEIQALGAELGVVVAYGSLLKRDALDALTRGWFNLHYSLLPKYRGAAPVQHALLNGDRETGVTLFKLDEGMDTGEILSQTPTPINAGENAADLLSRLTLIGCALLSESIPQISSSTHSLKPQSGEVSFAPKLTRELGRIDWQSAAKAIECQVLACTPEPSAWSLLNGQSFKVLDAVALPQTEDLAPGELALHGAKVLVGTGSGHLMLQLVQPASKRVMAAMDWARGALKPETRFEA